MMEVVFLLIGLLAGILAGYFIAKSKYSSSGGVDASELDTLRTENSRLATDKAKAEERSLLNEKNLNESKAELDSARDERVKYSGELAALQAVNSSLEKKLEEQKKELEELQQKFVTEFENLANKILDEKSKKFTEQNEKNIGDLLKPLKERISDFEKKVDETYKSEAGERNILRGEINKLIEQNLRIGEQAEGLTKALRSDKKMQGDWGEERLDILLEKAGLKEGLHYSKQKSFKDEEGKTKRLDVIVNLPDNKNIIIDSKVSLNAYVDYSNAVDEESRSAFLKLFVNNIYSHVDDLSSKNYQQLYGIGSPEYVLMYIPIEPAFFAAVENDKELFLYALEKKNIVLVTTTSLLATLSTISYIWKQENQKRNVLDIAEQSGALYDKLSDFVKDLIDIGTRIDSSKDSYEKAMNKLVEGRGNIIRRIEQIKQLGAKASKNIDPRIINRAADEDPEGLELIKPD